MLRWAVYAELDRRAPLECLYAEGLASGLGANPAGLDRGELGPTTLLRIRVVGERALIEALNSGFRAEHGDASEAASTSAAFPTSILTTAPVVAIGEDERERVLVDLGAFLIRDAHHVTAHLERVGEGRWDLDPETSTVELTRARAFPDNVELEAALTYVSQAPGQWAGSTAPDGARVTLRQHHSLIRLPEPGFRPRSSNRSSARSRCAIA